LMGIDRDPTALQAARSHLAALGFGERVTLLHGRFSDLRNIVAEYADDGVDVVLADFGVSSSQLDDAERGFSFRNDGPLDMRMDPTVGSSAREIIASIEEAELAEIIRTLGEERFAKRIARALVQDKPTTTLQAAGIIRRVVPKSKETINPATRTFQALRMLVNAELGEIEAWLGVVIELLSPGGVAMAISFHSLEDRPVKRAFVAATVTCVCPPTLPVCVCHTKATAELLTKRPIRATPQEQRSNHRSRSAKLRAVRRIGVGS